MHSSNVEHQNALITIDQYERKKLEVKRKHQPSFGTMTTLQEWSAYLSPGIEF